MDRYRLLSLLKQEENPQLDFKASLDLTTESQKKELAKDVTAIANSSSGRGYILFGVEDKTKRLIGVNPVNYQEEQIQQVLANRIDPPVNARVEFVDIQGFILAVLTIFHSFNKPHQLRQTGAFYVRRGSTTDYARREELANMLQYEGLLFNELIPLPQLDASALDMDGIKHYLKRASVVGDFQESCLQLGFLHYDRYEDAYLPTVGGLLLFGKEPQLHLPHTGVHIVNVSGNRKESVTVKGNLIEMLEKTVEIIDLMLKYTPFPKGVYQEAIANALVHRDYFDTSRQITIFISSKRIEITNPGASTEGDRKEGASRERNPSRRNMWLYDRLTVIDTQNRFRESGIGLIHMKKALQGKGRIKILNSKKSNLFRLVITIGKE